MSPISFLRYSRFKKTSITDFSNVFIFGKIGCSCQVLIHEVISGELTFIFMYKVASPFFNAYPHLIQFSFSVSNLIIFSVSKIQSSVIMGQAPCFLMISNGSVTCLTNFIPISMIHQEHRCFIGPLRHATTLNLINEQLMTSKMFVQT